MNPALASFELSASPKGDILSPDFLFPSKSYDSFEIELGCGKGLFLAETAARHPHNLYVGIESARTYARFSENRLRSRGVTNARILDWAAELVLSFFGSETADRFHIYFPDPWPKRRHRARRFLTPELFREIGRILKPQGKVYLGTDFAEYFESTLELEGDSPLRLERKENHRFFEDAPEKTTYEQKFIREGRPLYFASFIKKGS